MSENKTIIQDLYRAFAEGDIPTVVSAFTEDAHWTEAEGFPYGGTYIGADDVLTSVFMRLATEWDGWAAIPNDFIAEGNTVVAIGEYSGTYKATGKSFKAPFVHVWKMADGMIQTFVQHTDTVLVRDAM